MKLPWAHFDLLQNLSCIGSSSTGKQLHAFWSFRCIKWQQWDSNPESLSWHLNTQPFSQIWPVWLDGWVFVYELSGCRFDSRCCHLNFRYRVCFEQELLGIQATMECKFTMKSVRDMMVTYSVDVYWDNRWFNWEPRIISTYFHIYRNYIKYTQPPG